MARPRRSSSDCLVARSDVGRRRNTHPAGWRQALFVAGLALGTLAAPRALADGQTDPGLKAVVQAAIASRPCFEKKYDDVVWYATMEPRVEKRLSQLPPDLRLGYDRAAAARRILRAVRCEASKHIELRDRPQLVLAVPWR